MCKRVRLFLIGTLFSVTVMSYEAMASIKGERAIESNAETNTSEPLEKTTSLAPIKTTIDKFCARLECQSWMHVDQTLRDLRPQLLAVEKSALTFDDIESFRKFSRALTKLLYDLYYLKEEGDDLTDFDEDCDSLLRETEAIAYTLTLPS